MAHLHLPLTLLPSGTFERAANDEDVLLGRLRFYVLSGMTEYHRMPSSSIRTIWLQLYTMGASSRFGNIIEENQLNILENAIREELNVWLEGTALITQVKLFGNEEQGNAIQFRSENKEITFRFTYAPRGAGSIGQWNMMEESRGIF